MIINNLLKKKYFSSTCPRALFRSCFGLLLALLVITPHVQAAGDPVALYTFKEGEGRIIRDVSGVGDPLDLRILDAANVSWIQGGGISINLGTMIASSDPATKIVEAAQQSNEFSTELWVRPSALNLTGPARIATISLNPSIRNFTIGQERSWWETRIRTTEGDTWQGIVGGNGLPRFSSVEGTLETRLMHVVYTRTASGQDILYIDGQEIDRRTSLGGDLSGWNTGYLLALGAEIDNSRYWLGEIHYAAFYARALTDVEVEEKYEERAPRLEIAELSPAPGTHFHPASEGLRFRAVSLRETAIAQENVKLTLNGADVSGALQFTGDAQDWEVTYTDLVPAEEYEATIVITDDEANVQQIAFKFDTYLMRDDALLALYTFEEGSGTVVRDHSEAGPPLDLTIFNPALTQWMEGGGLALEGNVRVASTTPPSKVVQAAQKSNAISLVAWIRSTNPDLTLARVATISSYRTNFPGGETANDFRNVSLIQSGDAYQGYGRTTETNFTGRPPLTAPEVGVTAPKQVVYTREADGQARLYVDGQEVASQVVEGDFSNWDQSYLLALGRELNELINQGPADHRFRHWEGEFFRMAIYGRALSPAEVQVDFVEFQGDPAPPSVPESLSARAGASFVELTWDDSTHPDGWVAYEVERSGEIIASNLRDSRYVDINVLENSTYTYRVRSVNFAGNFSDFSSTVNATTSFLAEVTGVARGEFYTGIEGNFVVDLTNAGKFPNSPDQLLTLPFVETPLNWGNNYGTRLTGWFVAPETGDYVFFLSSDYDGEFWLSEDDSPGNLKFLVYDDARSGHRDWTGTAGRPNGENRSDRSPFSQMPERISLFEGQRYYYEALMKAAGGGADHLGVTFKLWDEPDPENGSSSRMTGDLIIGLGDPDFVQPSIDTQPVSRTVEAGESVTLAVTVAPSSSEPISYRWLFNNEPISGATEAEYAIDSFRDENQGVYSVVVSNVAGKVSSVPALVRFAFDPPAYAQKVLQSNPIAYWRFDEIVGSTVSPDELGTHHAVLVNGPGLFQEAQVGPAMRFRAAENQYAEAPDHPDFDLPGSFSIEFWMNLQHNWAGSQWEALVGKGDNTWSVFRNQSGDRLRFQLRGGDAPNAFVNSNFSIPRNQWTHVVAVYDDADGEMRFYFNGVQDRNTVARAGSVGTNTFGVQMGVNWSGTAYRRYYDGLLDEVAIYGHALPPETIEAHYLAGLEDDTVAPPLPEVAPRLDIFRSNGQIVLDWDQDDGYRLETTEDLGGPWVEVMGVTPPIEIVPDEKSPRGFYRLVK